MLTDATIQRAAEAFAACYGPGARVTLSDLAGACSRLTRAHVNPEQVQPLAARLLEPANPEGSAFHV